MWQPESARPLGLLQSRQQQLAVATMQTDCVLEHLAEEARTAELFGINPRLLRQRRQGALFWPLPEPPAW